MGPPVMRQSNKNRLHYASGRRITGIALLLVGGLMSYTLSEPDEKAAMLVMLVLALRCWR